mmetsp:Transcript_75227/g.207518  ORF Transcript_75227/g.207518 Transcript_75227/m.207518 type:complete len:221 (-) Transcript_75227:62-724(-)
MRTGYAVDRLTVRCSYCTLSSAVRPRASATAGVASRAPRPARSPRPPQGPSQLTSHREAQPQPQPVQAMSHKCPALERCALLSRTVAPTHKLRRHRSGLCAALCRIAGSGRSYLHKSARPTYGCQPGPCRLCGSCARVPTSPLSGPPPSRGLSATNTANASSGAADDHQRIIRGLLASRVPKEPERHTEPRLPERERERERHTPSSARHLSRLGRRRVCH